MMRKLAKPVLAVAAVAAVGASMWIIAGIWHNLIMANLYEDVHATHDGLGLLLAAYFVLATFMVYLYPAYRRGNHPVVNGFVFGAIIGLLWVFPHGLAMAGAHDTSVIYVVKNSVWHMVEQGIGGIVVGLIFGRG
jgi:hypothetical protein